jgi:hypothetical protein
MLRAIHYSEVTGCWTFEYADGARIVTPHQVQADHLAGDWPCNKYGARITDAPRPGGDW